MLVSLPFTSSPRFVAGASGQRDVVLLLDVSRAGQSPADGFQQRTALAEALLRTLSFRDYVGIVAYSSGPVRDWVVGWLGICLS